MKRKQLKKSTKKPDNRVGVFFKLDPKLRNQLGDRAKETHRQLAAYLEMIVEEHLRNA